MKTLTCLLFLCCALSLSAIAQNPRFGIKGGPNFSMFSAAINSTPALKPGFNLGMYARHQFTEKLHLRPEVYFSSQGQKDNYETASGQSLGSTKTTINAINVPILLEAGSKVTFQIGPQFGLLLSGTEKGTVDRQSVNDDLKEIMKPIDFSLILGVGFNANENLNFGLRYNFGLTSNFDSSKFMISDFPTVANRVIHLYIGYSL